MRFFKRDNLLTLFALLFSPIEIITGIRNLSAETVSVRGLMLSGTDARLYAVSQIFLGLAMECFGVWMLRESLRARRFKELD